MAVGKKGKSEELGALERICTFNLHKRMYNRSHKYQAKYAIKEIKAFATKNMKTKNVKINDALNRFIWKQGARTVPNRVRLVMKREVAPDYEEGGDKWYTEVDYIPVASFKNLTTENKKENVI